MSTIVFLALASSRIRDERQVLLLKAYWVNVKAIFEIDAFFVIYLLIFERFLLRFPIRPIAVEGRYIRSQNNNVLRS
jgi:hypothetical protein